MPLFKSTHNILRVQDENEVFDPNWMDSDKLVLPPTKEWDYKREMTIEDVDIWEILFEGSPAKGVYAAWAPYAEFYMVCTGPDYKQDPYTWKDHYSGDIRWTWNRQIQTFYGPGAQKKVIQLCKEADIPLHIFETWVDDKDLWLYQEPQRHEKKIII